MRLALILSLWCCAFTLGIFLNCHTHNQTDCLQCDPGYYVQSGAGDICKSLEACQYIDQANCQRCNHTKCLYDGQPKECRAGYFLRWTPERLVCISCKSMFCAICDEFGQCTSCQEGYGMIRPVSACYPCPLGCKYCSAAECTECYPSYSKDNQTKLCYASSKYIGKYIDSNYNLADCMLNCKYCLKNSSGCQQCAEGFFLTGKYAVSCEPCPAKCLTCYNLTHCTSCRSGLLRYYNCQNNCLDSQYYSYLEGMCKSCDSSCLSCFSTRQNCTACRDPIQFRLQNNSCIQRCPSGQYAVANNQTAYNLKIFTEGYIGCYSCPAGCLVCTNTSYCLKCNQTKYMKDGGCLDACPDRYYSQQLIKFRVCLKWQTVDQSSEAACQMCYRHNICTKCDDEFDLLGGRCIIKQPSTCLTYKMNQLCLAACPTNTVASQQTCQCHSSCKTCVYEASNKKVTCLQCFNPAYFEHDGLCTTECPVYSVGQRCVDKCPDSYKLKNKQCVLECSDVQTETECISYNSTKYIDYEQLFSNQPSEKDCPLNCDKCLNSDRCLNCSNGYLQNTTNHSIGCGACAANYVTLLNTLLCQPCRNNCSACVDFLYLSEQQCKLVCQGRIQGNVCVSTQQINITLHGFKTPMNQYSHTQELIITIWNNYDDKSQIDFMQLTSPLKAETNFRHTRNFSTANVTLNSSVLKPSTVYEFFVKDRNHFQSVQFMTVDAANATFFLSSESYRPIDDVLTVTIRNFNSSGQYAFKYVINVSSTQDKQISIVSGFADISLPNTEYNISFRMPLVRSSSVYLTVTLMSNYSQVQSIHNMYSVSQQDKMDQIFQELDYITQSNYTTILNSILSVVGEKYIRTSACSCLQGICIKQQCICSSYRFGRYCQYTNAQKINITRMQNRLLSFIMTNRRLLTVSTIDKLTILEAITRYPDILDSNQLARIQNLLGSLQPTDPVKYLFVVMGIQDSCQVLKVDCTDYLKEKLLIAAHALTSLKEYALYSPSLSVRIVNSNYDILQQLMSQDLPEIVLAADLWSVSYRYGELPQGSYLTPMYPFLVSFNNSQQRYFYFSYGDEHDTPIKIKLPISLSRQEEMLMECRSDYGTTDVQNGSCRAFGSKWVIFQVRQVIQDETNSSVGMLVYGVLMFFLLFGLLVASEIRYYRRNITKVAADSIILEPRKRKKDELDDLTEVGKERSIDIGAIPIQKDLEPAVSSEDQLPQPRRQDQQENPGQNVQENRQSPENQQNEFTYFHLLKSSVIWPESIYICTLFLEAACCHLTTITLIQLPGIVTFVIGVTLLVSFYFNILIIIARCTKNCCSRRGPQVFIIITIGLIMVVVGLIDAAALDGIDQFIDWIISILMLLFSMLIKDGIIFLYCRGRNEQKHKLASIMRNYIRWQHMMSQVEEAKQSQQ